MTPPQHGKIVNSVGEMADRVRAHDWSLTPLGAIDHWSETLVCSVNLMLSCRFPTVIFWGPEMVQFYNDAYLPLMSEKHPGALGQTASKCWKEAWHIIGPQFEAVLRSGESTYQENVLVPVTREGQLLDIYWTYSYSAIFDSAGGIAGILIVCKDVTEEILAKRERGAFAERLNQVLEATTDGVLSVDRDWRVTYLNHRAEDILAPSGDILGKDLWETFPDALYEGSPYVEHYHRAMNEGIAGDFEAYYPEPLNIWFDVQTRPTSTGIVLFFRDVTEQKRSVEALRQTAEALSASEEELRWTVKLSAQIPWTADPEGRILDFSDYLLTLTGITRRQALDEGWIRVTHPEDLQSVSKAWKHALRTGQPYDVEHRIRMASGESCWMRSRAFPRQDDGGNVVKWYGTTEDIETRKKAEEAVRTTEKLAAVGRLAASIAHEINNPLESVTNLLYLARTSNDPEKTQEYLDSAECELRRVSVISNQTLRFYKQSTNPRAVTCEDLFETVLSIYQGRFVNSRVEVEKRRRATRPVMCFDGEIRQVLSNIVGNAIDAMHPSGGRLLVRSREATNWKTGREGLMLTISDTGPGISPTVMKKMFEPFFTTKGIGGTGLGLWVSQEIVERHHGVLRVRSSQKEGSSGTAFTLFLGFDALSR